MIMEKKFTHSSSEAITANSQLSGSSWILSGITAADISSSVSLLAIS
ncbi:MAG: hypothetical protein U5J96_10405 [Ignavibacteriaceae bacterium]|nr:hypothetical protein [Ignavibacteriaceae bacterium]